MRAIINKRTLVKFTIAIAICFAVHILVGLFSSLIVNNFILNARLANFTIYDGYADFGILLAYIPVSALLVFDKVKVNALLISVVAFVVILTSKVFIIDVIEHYVKFYVKIQQNGAYSFEIFTNRLARNLVELLWEFCNLGQVLSFIIWVFLALLCICYLSIYSRNKLIILQ